MNIDKLYDEIFEKNNESPKKPWWKKIAKYVPIIFAVLILLLLIFGLNGCSKAYRVNENIRREANDFGIRRRVIALNTRTNDALFEVEGMISIGTDGDGDLNVTIDCGDGTYKLFYAHLSKDVTYTCVQLDGEAVNPYAYEIRFFPARDVIENGLVDLVPTD